LTWHRAPSTATTDVATSGGVSSAGDSGAALVAVLLLGLLLGALGATVAIVADTDTLIASNQREALVARHTAEAAAEFAIQELSRMGAWTPALTGAASSALAGPLVQPAASGGAPVDASALTTTLQQETYGGNPWGADTPRWRVYAHGVPGVDLPFGGLTDRAYVLVWVSDDIAETDGDPLADGNGIVVVRARAIGPGRSRADVQIVLALVAPGVARRVSSRVIR